MDEQSENERQPPRLTIVIPCLNEGANLPDLRRRLSAVLEPLAQPYEVIVVDDGSTDGSVAYVERWIDDDAHVVLIKLSRNFGMEVAMSAGLDHARGDQVLLMHADLQDPPELIPEMLQRASEGAEVVYARRIGRDESILKRTLATAFYALMGRVARVPYQGQAGDFRLMSRRVVDAVRAMPERRRFLGGWSLGSAMSRCRLTIAERAVGAVEERHTLPFCASRSKRCRRSRMCRSRLQAGLGCSSPRSAQPRRS